jgi:Tol biopolymer transport system component
MNRHLLPPLAASLLVAAFAGLAAQAHANADAKNGRLVFRRYLDVAKRSGAIFTVNPDGTSVTQVTHPRGGANDTEPDWSRDGTKIAFERQLPCPAGGARDGLDNTCDLVYTMRRDGSGLRQLVPCGFKANKPFPGNCVGVDHPGWSPDSSRLAFQYSLVDRRYTRSKNVSSGIWIVKANGTGARQVTQRKPGGAWDFGPQWSPDGRRLTLFRLDIRTDTEAVYTVNVDGTSEARVTPKGLNAANPNWSPDGQWILFTGEAKNGASNLYAIHPDGTGMASLTNEGPGGYHYTSGSYSPDGTMIGTARTPGTGPEGAADVFVMNADGTEARAVTKTRLWDSGVDWGTAPLR